MKRFFVMILIVLILVPLPVDDVSHANSSLIIGDYTAEVIGGNSVRIIDYSGDGGDIVIPQALAGRWHVIEIGTAAFERKNITGVVLPPNLQRIGMQAFFDNNITEVFIPKNVKSIGYAAFGSNESQLKEKVYYVEGKDIEFSDFPFTQVETGLPPFLTPQKDHVTVYAHEGSTIHDVIKGGYTGTDYNFINIEGEVNFSPNGKSSFAQSHSTKVDVKGNDTGKPLQYVWSVSTSTPSSGWTNFTNGQNITRSSGAGNYYLHIRGTNYLGEVFTKKSEGFLIDELPPFLILDKNGGDYAKRHTAKITIYDVGSGLDRVEYRWTTGASFPTSGFTTTSNGASINTPTSTGNHYLHVKMVDKVGNVGKFTSNVFKVDNTAPTLAITTNTSNWTNGNITITARGSDSHSGVKRIREVGGTWVNGTSTTKAVSSNGTYSFEVEDNVGNTRTQSITVSNIDKTLPTVSISKNGGTWATAHSTTINASDSGSGIDRVEYRWTTGTSFPTSGFTATSNGSTISAPTSTGNHYLHVKVTDKAGNARNFTSSVFRVDRTAPSAPSISGSTEWRSSNQSITISQGSDSHSGVDKTQYRLDNGSWTTYSSVISISKEGSTKVDARTLDKAGNESSIVTQTIKIDKTAPTIDITPDTTATTHGDIVLTVKGTDKHSGVKRIREVGGTWVTSDTLNKTVKTNGTYEFEVEDNAGNVTKGTIKVDNIDKTISYKKGTIKEFGDIVLTENTKTVGTDIEDIVISDWREGDNTWSLQVSATPLKNGRTEMPKGTIAIQSVDKIERVSGTGKTPVKSLNNTTEIDNGVVEIVKSTESRGEYKFGFPKNALEIKVDPTEMETGVYESTVTWDVVTAP